MPLSIFRQQNRGKSIRWHPSLEVGPGSDPHFSAARGAAERAVEEYGLGLAGSAAASSRSGRGIRYALASLALAGLAGTAFVASSGLSLKGVQLIGQGRPKFDPETYAAAGYSYEERISGSAAAAAGGRSLGLVHTSRSSSKGDDGANKEAEEQKRESAEGYRKLQLSGGFGGERGQYLRSDGPSDERSVIQITEYDASPAPIPAFYDKFGNVFDTFNPSSSQPLFWYVPKAGGNTLNKIFAHCLSMVVCSSVASTVPGALDGEDLVINTFQDGSRYINADPSTLAGLTKLKDGQIAATDAAQVIITQRLEASKMLFEDPVPKMGRLFAMFRHPIKRVVDQFYYRQRATWEAGYDSTLATMSLEEFAASDRLVENFVVRSLVHKLTTDVTAADVQQAKDVLRQKFVVGIFEWFDLSVVRFEKYFGWWDEKSVLMDTSVNHCHYDRIATGGHVGAHPRAEAGSEAYKKIAVRNWADLELYFYAKNLFYAQAALI